MAPAAALTVQRIEVMASPGASPPPFTKTCRNALPGKSLHNSSIAEDVKTAAPKNEAEIPLIGCAEDSTPLECLRSMESPSGQFRNGDSFDSFPDLSTFDFSGVAGLANCTSKGALLNNTPVLSPSLDLVDITEGRDQETSVEVLNITHQKLAYHSEVVEVVSGGEAFSSRLVTKVPFAQGSTIAKIEGATIGVNKRYTTVQCGLSTHLELNSDLVYINHSCNPNVAMDVDRMEVRALRDIGVGEELTFFYPSTEWDMDQAFQCWCKAEQCVGMIAGAKHLSAEVLGRYCISKHIRIMTTTGAEGGV